MDCLVEISETAALILIDMFSFTESRSCNALFIAFFVVMMMVCYVGRDSFIFFYYLKCYLDLIIMSKNKNSN